MDIRGFIAWKKYEIDEEWGDCQRDEWTNGYYNCLLEIEQLLNIKPICKCHLSENEEMCNLPNCQGRRK